MVLHCVCASTNTQWNTVSVCSGTLVVSKSLCPHGLQPARLLCPRILQARTLEWVSKRKKNQRSNPRLLHCRQIFFTAEPLGKSHDGLLLSHKK